MALIITPPSLYYLHAVPSSGCRSAWRRPCNSYCCLPSRKLEPRRRLDVRDLSPAGHTILAKSHLQQVASPLQNLLYTGCWQHLRAALVAQSLEVSQPHRFAVAVHTDVRLPGWQMKMVVASKWHAKHARVRGARLDTGDPGLQGSFWANFRPLSSCRSPQAALKFSYCSDRVTRGGPVVLRVRRTERDAKGGLAGRALGSSGSQPCQEYTAEPWAIAHVLLYQA